ncbi:phytanoyl-CoA dioxygenase family protein [Ferrimonas sediminum]|uniref:phytanoyl-CoA dioxygenase family protein n=1 Tax=Ferrimonas sediminum TaxID=718193 RepID=UPI00115FECB9|nr:phytanoyl-CoA dioxygenase family protein [Ferrimonas sediminum]
MARQLCGLRYIPGTQHGLEPIQTLSEEHGWQLPGVVEQPAQAGDIMIQDMMILHGSQTKRSDGTRRTLYIELRPLEANLTSGAQSDGEEVPSVWRQYYGNPESELPSLMAQMMALKEPPLPALRAYPVAQRLPLPRPMADLNVTVSYWFYFKQRRVFVAVLPSSIVKAAQVMAIEGGL